MVDTSLSFDSSGWISTDSTGAVFRALPPSPLFTLNMDVPHSWMVEAIYSPYDLDNIHLASVENGVEAEFVLEYILVEGKYLEERKGREIEKEEREKKERLGSH